ncbi:MAG: HDOD domain-containing protein [Deltaproteobacteria bacterium]
MTDTPPFRIMLVDDDASVLSGLKNVLRRDRHHWSVRSADGAETALRELAREPADVVVTDMRMPGMDGVELLGHVLVEWPGTARVLLSGWSDMRSITRAGTVAQRYLLKPCDGETLRTELAGVQRVQATLPDVRLRAALGALRSLPSSPGTLKALSSLPEDSGERNLAAAAAAETDVALATRILQFVSSPSFGPQRRVSGLRAAIGLVGQGVLREIASLLEPLPSSASFPGAFESLARLERHAQTSSQMARVLAGDGDGADTASTAALLHDCGRLAILSRLAPLYADILLDSARTGRTRAETEREVLGADHARIGAYLLALWGLPEVLVDAVAHHHDEGILDEPGLSGLVATADLLAHQADATHARSPR